MADNDTTITAKFVADIADFQKSIEEVATSTKELETSTKGLAESLAATEAASKQAAEGISGIGEASGEASGNMQGVGSAGKDAATGIGDIESAGKDAAKGLEDIGSASKSAASEMKSVGEAGKSAGEGMATIGESSQRAGEGMTGVGTAAEETKNKVKEVGTEGSMSLQDIANSAANAINPWMQIIQVAQMAGQAIAAAGAQAAQVKSTQGAFDQLTQSASKTDEMLGQLNSSAAAHDFGAKAVDDAAQRMLMMGADAKTVVPEIGKVADGLAAMGGSAQHLTPVIDQLDKMRSEARITTSDMNNLVSQGLPAWEALAQGMGTTVTQAQHMVADGDVQGAKAYQDMLKGLEQYGGAAEAQSHDLGAEYDRLTTSSKGAFGGLSDWFAMDLEGINEMIDGTWRLNQNIEDLLSNIGKAMTSGMGSPFSGGGGGVLTGSGIPGHAAGGTNLSGLSVVGENGPELFDPNGGSIYPLADTTGGANPALAGGGSSGPVTIQIYLDSMMLAQQILPQIAPMIRVMTGRRQ